MIGVRWVCDKRGYTGKVNRQLVNDEDKHGRRVGRCESM